MAELCAKHTWQLVEVDISEHGEIGRYVCTEVFSPGRSLKVE